MPIGEGQIDIEKLGDRLLLVILLLAGNFIFTIIITPIMGLMELGEWAPFVLVNSYWIGNIIFGVIMFSLTRKYKVVTFPIGILSILLPMYGALFYLLVSVINKNPSE